jgi:hypothetical protein
MTEKFYAQGDWVGAAIPTQCGIRMQPGVQLDYENALKRLANVGIENVATWHLEGVGVNTKADDTDSNRNLRQVTEADSVLTILSRTNPESRHWSRLA